MDHIKTLVDQLRALVASVGDPQEVEGYEPDSADVTIARRHRVSISDKELQSLITTLRGVPKLNDMDGGIAHHSPASESSISLDSIAHWLLAQTRMSSPEECVDSLLAAIEKNQSSILEIIPVWGISPRVSVDLGEGMKIVPIQDLPPSRLKDLFTGKKRHRYSFDIANSSPRPGAAIVKETVHGPLYESSSSEAAIANRRRANLMLAAVMAPGDAEKQGALADIAQMMDPLKRQEKARPFMKTLRNFLLWSPFAFPDQYFSWVSGISAPLTYR